MNRQQNPPRRGGFGGHIRGGGQKAKDFKKAIRNLIIYLKPYLIPLIISFLFAIIGTVCIIVGPKYIGDITSEIQLGVKRGNIDLKVISNIGILLVILYLIGVILQIIQSFIMTKITQIISRKLRSQISTKINKLPLKYYDSRTYGDILSVVTNDVDTISQSLNQSLPHILSSITTVVGAIVMMLLSSRILTLITLVTIPLSGFFMTKLVKFSQKFFSQQQYNLGDLNGHIEEIYSGQNIVKLFNYEEETNNNFDSTNYKLYTSAWKSNFFSDLMRPLMIFVGNLSYIAVTIIGGIYALEGVILLGVVQTFLIYVRRVNRPMTQIAQTATILQSTAAAAERVFDFLEEIEMTDEREKSAIINEVKGKVEFKNVKFGYDKDKLIIKNFNAIAYPGQKIAIVGPTGAGKTTIVNLLMRFYDVTEGDILIDGVSIYNLKREEI